MITFKEILGKTPISEVDIAYQHNIEELVKRINVIRAAWGKPMLVTSGFRSMHDHKRIYSELNAKRRSQNLPELKIPMSSKHLYGEAVDISDPDGSLHDWCKANESLLEEVGLWCEEKDSQARVHFQIEPPNSGKRFFYP